MSKHKVAETFEVKRGEWKVSHCEARYKPEKWHAIHESYDGMPEHPGFVYAPTWPELRDEIEVADEELCTPD